MQARSGRVEWVDAWLPLEDPLKILLQTRADVVVEIEFLVCGRGFGIDGFIFELVKLNGESPEEVAKELGVQRNVIDNTVFKAMKRLREISKREEIQQEL